MWNNFRYTGDLYRLKPYKPDTWNVWQPLSPLRWEMLLCDEKPNSVLSQKRHQRYPSKQSCEPDRTARRCSRIWTSRGWGVAWGVRIIARPVIPLRYLLMERRVFEEMYKLIRPYQQICPKEVLSTVSSGKCCTYCTLRFSHNAVRLFTLLFYLKRYTGVYLVRR